VRESTIRRIPAKISQVIARINLWVYSQSDDGDDKEEIL
jgi:hypothetical protein